MATHTTNKELDEILIAIKRLQKSGKRGALATVVKTQGSAYRRPGARMLFSESGPEAGFVSGACQEKDLTEKVLGVIASAMPCVVSYDATSPQDIVMGWGLGCNGVVEILIQPLNDWLLENLRFLQGRIVSSGGIVNATVFRVDGVSNVLPGSTLTVDFRKNILIGIGNPNLAAEVVADALAAVRTLSSVHKKYSISGSTFEAFIEVIQSAVPLLIFGANADARPVAKLAKELGWNVTVVDHRSAFATKENIPFADSVVLSAPEEVERHVKFQQTSVSLIMTHNFFSDLALLKALLPSPVRYIGLLGPKSKLDLLVQHLEQDGFHASREQLARLHSPVGIDIGAETPEEIAFSIIAEIKAVLEGRSAGFLKNHTGPIHNPSRNSS